MIIGIYGGSFDPIHSGHAMVANFIAQCNIVDEVWITVSRRNPLKKYDTSAGDRDRLAMAGIVAEKCSDVKVCDIEMDLSMPSFTYDTFRALQSKYPSYGFKLIIGSDSLQNFDRWKEYKKIQNEFGLIVYPRPGYPMPDKEPDNMTFLNGAPEFSISSSLIREYAHSGWNINYFVPPEVAEYIKTHNLYI